MLCNKGQIVHCPLILRSGLIAFQAIYSLAFLMLKAAYDDESIVAIAF